MTRTDEARRVESGPGPGERPGRAGLSMVTFSSEEPVSAVVERARQVLSGVLAATAQGWNEDAARASLPAWFTAAFAPEPTDEEEAEYLRWWRALDGEGRARAAEAERWTAAGWLSWLDPDEREWRWWDAYVDDETTARIAVEIGGWPFAIGALEWLLRASGATTVTVD